MCLTWQNDLTWGSLLSCSVPGGQKKLLGCGLLGGLLLRLTLWAFNRSGATWAVALDISKVFFWQGWACFKAYNARVQFFQKAENKTKKAKMHKNIKRIGKLLIFFSCIHFFFAWKTCNMPCKAHICFLSNLFC